MKFLAETPWRARVARMAFAFGLSCALAIPTAFAQNEDEEKIEPVEERMTVTGSRIKRTDAEEAAPIDVITRADIERTGAASIDRILQELPAVTGGALNTNISNGNDDRSTLTLRGLPSSNTLILLNGRRLVNHGRASASVDLNTIPLQIVERIEVFKDGGSAVYGSDAVAGVVNIITRKDFRGLEIPLYFGQSKESDLDTQDYSFAFGTGNDKGSVILSGNFYDQGIVWSRDRDISNDADNSRFGIASGFFNRSSAPTFSRINVPGVGIVRYDPALGDGTDVTHYRAFDNTVDRYNFREETPAIIPQQRANIFLSGNYEFVEGLTAFVEAYYVQTRTRNSLAPTPFFSPFNGFGPISVAADNIYNPFGVDIPDIRRRFIELGNRNAERSGDNYRFVSGVQGAFGEGWDWDASFLWHEDNRRNFQSGALIGPNMNRALGPAAVCAADPNCVPLNLFGGPGNITQEMLDYVSTGGLFTGRAEIKALNANLSGTLGYLQGGPIGMAVGGEYREEYGEDNPDSLVSQGTTIGFTNFQRTSGSREVGEVYAEFNFPFVSGKPGAQILELNIAGRYSDYSDFGTNFSPKFGIRWQPIEEVLVRATSSEAFKVPTLNQLFSGDSQSFPTLNDPLQPTADTRTQFLTIFGSNANLEAEESDVFTVGLVIEPVDNLSFTLDFFDISQEKVVAANAQFILDENARTINSGNPLFADRVIRDANGFLTRLIATPINVGRREVSGTDFSMEVRVPDTSIGNLKFNLNSTYMDSWRDQSAAGQPFVERAGTFDSNDGPGSVPEWRGNLMAALNRDDWNLGLSFNYISDYQEIDPLNDVERTVDSWLTIDTQFSMMFPDIDTSLSVGIDNLTDEDPPFSAQAFNDNFDGSMHNLIGTFWYVRVSKRF